MTAIAILAQIHLVLSVVEVEHSKDSSRRTQTVKVVDGKLILEDGRVVNGRPAPPPAPRMRQLDAAGEKQIRALVAASKLVDAKDIDMPFKGPGIEVTITLDWKDGGTTKKLKLHGPLSEWKGEGKPDATAFVKTPEYEAAARLHAELARMASAR